MLDKTSKIAAARARARDRRARRRAGILRDFRIRVPTKRLVAALRLAEPRLPEGELSTEIIERELGQVVNAFIDLWLKARR